MRRLLALIVSACLTVPGCAQTAPTGGSASVGIQGGQALVEQLLPEPEPEPTVAHLMVAGDVMSHMPLTNDTYVAKTGEYDYAHVLQFAAKQLEGADYAVANLETVLAGGPKYSGYPTFNSPDGLAYGIRGAGFDLLATANNHSRDQGVKGIFRTLDVLDKVGLAHVGTYRSQQERDARSGIHVADVGGISVAFLAYTYGLNGFRLDSDHLFAANLFNEDYYTTLKTPNETQMKADLAAARAMDTDLIAVMIHWGVEYKNAPNEYQQSLARFLVEQGADLVLGGHPHVLQPYETITATGWDGQQRDGFVCYSLGNFISNQQELETKTTAVLDLELTQDPDTGDTEVTGVSYTPYYMLHRDNQPVGQRRHLVNIHDAMAQYEAGETDLINKTAYSQLKAALAHCHKVLGEQGDSGQP